MSEHATVHGIGGAQTKLTRFLSAEGPEALDALAEHIEATPIVLTVLELSQLCAMLCRRLAKLERGHD